MAGWKIVLLTGVMLLVVWSGKAEPDSLPPRGQQLVVVVDPGHGGREKGARGVSGVWEKHLVLDIARRIERLLGELPDVKVIMTRKSDDHIGLWDRVDLANVRQADLFISVHANAFSRPELNGVETFFHSLTASDEEAQRVARAENAPLRNEQAKKQNPLASILADMRQTEILRDSSRFAHMVQDELVKVVPFENLGVRQADFVVLRGTKMPAVLLELGFMSNRRDERLLKKLSTQEQIAQAVRLAVVKFKSLMQQKRVIH